MTAQTKSVNPQTGGIAPLTNCMLFDALMERVMSRHKNLPAMGALVGHSGDGKSTSATYGGHRHRAYYVEVGSSWTLAKFCRSLSIELGIPAKGIIADLIDGIIGTLAQTNRPLIIDEFDHVVRRNYVEAIREIHDKSGAAIILIGEEELPHKLQKFDRFHSRVLDWERSQPCDLRDAQILTKIYAPGLQLDDELLTKVVEQTRGNTRRVSVTLNSMREQASLEGWKKIDVATWGKRPIHTGAVPARRAQ